MLKNVKFTWPVAQVALQHHERMDGSGYPQGLRGEAIPRPGRILSIAEVHDLLTASREGDVDLSDLIRRVSAMLGHGLGTPAAAEELAHVEVPGDTATAVALIFSELYANAHEHGGGDVRVSLAQQGNTIELVVVDRGPGLPDGFDPERSLGLKIALALATDQLRGALLLEDAAPGVRARLTWSTA